MSLKFKPKTKSNKFDTVELIPSVDNYGKPSKKASGKRALPSFAEEQNKGLETSINMATGASEKDSDSLNGQCQNIFDNNDVDNANPTHSDNIDDDELDALDEHGILTPAKFGTFDGVLGRCLLCMWGVIMFLRTGWIVGNAGIWQTTLVMTLSASITMFTTLSLSAICTNGEISHGGPYFLISRSLGPNLGGVIGLLFAVGNCVGVALHLVGFAEAITSLYSNSFFFGFDIQLIAELGLVVLMAISLRGVGSIIKFNLFLLFLMFISIIAFFIGTFMDNSVKQKVGFTGYSSQTFADNWSSAYLPGYSFLTMVAIFFPSVTGCMAGANISGDLKKPSVNIPVGTIAAVIFSMVVYVVIAWVLGACVDRQVLDASGHHIDGTGLYWNYMIMSDISVWRPLVDMGIYASTFSSATSCFVAAPRIFKAVCDDGLFPIFSFFAVGRAKDNEPVRCYVLVMVICFLIMLTGDINFIAPMVTNFFLITYALVNYSVFAWDISKSPGWRPTFKYYSPYLSLFATFQSVVLMFLIDWIMALATVIIGVICYKYIESRNPNVNWGTTVESALYLKGCRIALKYQQMNTEHAKIARPTFLIMLYGNNQDDVLTLFNFAKCINYGQGLIMIGHVMLGSLSDAETAEEYVLKRKNYLKYHLSADIVKQCIMECCISENYEVGTATMIQLAGMGGMQPNVFMIKIDESINNHQNNHLSIDTQQPLWFTNLTNALLSGLGVIVIPNKFNLTNILIDNDIASSGTIDIWWLFDDGGLTILTGYLLTKHKQFKNYKLRIMALSEIGFEDHTEMVSLVAKLRIDAEIKHVHSVEDEILFDIGVEDELDADEEKDENTEGKRRRKVSHFAKDKIIKYKRVGQTIQQNSRDAALCLLTMPYPRTKYKWWEYAQCISDLTPDGIPTVFVRGTQDQLLTFCF
jgi:amino acid transporter